MLGRTDGRLEGIFDGQVFGWAWFPDDPWRRLSIVVTVDGRPVASGLADGPRPSLLAEGIGDGCYGFALRLPVGLADGGTHVVGAITDSGEALPPADGFAVENSDKTAFATTSFIASNGDFRGANQSLAARGVAPAGPARAPTLNPAVQIAMRAAAVRERAAASLAGPWLALGAGCLVYFVIFLYLTRHFGFFGDEWAFIQERRPWDLTIFLAAYQQHLELIPVVVYKLLFATAGLSTTLPYRVIVFALDFTCVIGLYVAGRRQLGRWLGLIPAVLLLVLGAGYEVELWPINISFIGAMAGGVWALNLLDRGSRRSEIGAAILIAGSLASASAALPFAIAIGIELLLTGARRLWIVALPLALYLIWYLEYGRSDIVWGNLRHLALYDVKIAAYGFAGLAGLSTETFGTGGVMFVAGLLMLAGSIGWVLGRLITTRRLPPRAVTGIAAAVLFWTATALARAQFGQPDASRYVYVSAIFILIAAIALSRPRRLGLGAIGVIACAVGAVALLGLVPLRQWALDRTEVDNQQRVLLGAAQIAGPAGNPTFEPDPIHIPWIPLGQYLTIVKQLGSPAFTALEIERQPVYRREEADLTLIGAERIAPRKASLPQASACRRISGRSIASPPPGGTVYIQVPSNTRVKVWLRRVSPVFPAEPQIVLTGGRTFGIEFPRDASSLPWHAKFGLPPVSKQAGVASACLLNSA